MQDLRSCKAFHDWSGNIGESCMFIDVGEAGGSLEDIYNLVAGDMWGLPVRHVLDVGRR